MTFRAKKERLQEIYERFETDAHKFKKDAICKIGCTYCCTDVGNVDTTTLEGVIILERVNSLLLKIGSRRKRKRLHDVPS